MNHAGERVKERLTGDEWESAKKACRDAVELYGSDSIGVIAYRLEEGQRNQVWGKESNGNCVLVIIRNGRVATVFLRRDTQTFDLSVSRTDVLVDMTGTVLKKALTTQ
jgi:hypothetical protein